VIVGSVNSDLVMQLPRLPKPGETVRPARFREHPGGKGANLAVAAARLGAQVTLIAAVGDDQPGRDALAELRAAGVDVSWVRIVAAPTGTAMIFVDPAGENMIGVDAGANETLSASDVESALTGPELAAQIVIANLEVPLAAVRAAARAARSRRWRFVLNPAPPRELDAEIVSACTVITPNVHEVDRLGYGSATALLAAGAGAVVVTRGPDGADLIRPGMPTLHQGPFVVEAVDSTGAGDVFSAALACAMAEGRPLAEAVRHAAAAGALATRAVGARAGAPTAAEIMILMAIPGIGEQHEASGLEGSQVATNH
jgi:ribokinase